MANSVVFSNVAEVDALQYIVEGAAPLTPLPGFVKTFFLSDGMYYINELGVVTPISGGGGGGGAPVDATYIVQVPNATLTGEFALSELATGLLKNTTGTGVLTVAVPGVDYVEPGSVPSTFSPDITIDFPADTFPFAGGLYYSRDGSTRYFLGVMDSEEDDPLEGSQLGLYYYDDSGVIVDNIFYVDRENDFLHFPLGKLTAQTPTFTQAILNSPEIYGFTWVVGTPSSSDGIIAFNVNDTFGYRWTIGKDAVAETGANAGSNFVINRFDDSGIVIDTALEINRATGLLALYNGLALDTTGGAGHFLKQTSAGGTVTSGTIASADLTSALASPPAIGGTTPAAITGTTITGNHLVLNGAPGKIRPAADSTTAIQFANAAGTAFVTFDTTNGWIYHRRDQNTSTSLTVQNYTNNTAAAAIFVAEVASNRQITFGMFAANYTNVVAWTGKAAVITAIPQALLLTNYDAAGTIEFQTGGFSTSNIRLQIDASGNVNFGSLTAKTAVVNTAGNLDLWGTSSTTNRQMGSVVQSWATSTDASRKARVIFNVYDTAIREAIRIEATGSTALTSLGAPSTIDGRLHVVGPASGVTLVLENNASSPVDLIQGHNSSGSTIFRLNTAGEVMVLGGGGAFSGQLTSNAVVFTRTDARSAITQNGGQGLDFRGITNNFIGMDEFGVFELWGTSTTNERLIATFTQAFIDNTDATRTGHVDIHVYDTAARLAISMEASGSAPMIGFLGATAVVRPSALTAANGGTINSGDATTDAVIGNIRTRLGELETKLQALGLLS